MKKPYVDESIIENMPPVLKAIIQALGYKRAMQWLKHFGGLSIMLPSGDTEKLKLTKDELTRLRKFLKRHLVYSDKLYVPKQDKLILFLRNKQILKEKEFKHVDEIAGCYGLTSRQIYNICRCEGHKDERQLTLF